MNEFFIALITAVGLVLVLEGAIYALFPDGMKRMMSQMSYVPPDVLRRAGLVAAVIGAAIVWFVRG
ncbi:DUF2065 domain-containing protein [Aestuariispira insulae]|uniref:DUF2065 domain-containing protein n=1 Tax=Aestuariispira insulae TaxID=1461337 RepID=A0A3D9HXI0_9PROT|nr:DUF2065 domain-containing protein [Aestuariispira insulae]RED54207.1 hypothetical protein DFP90_1011010 [Aestuariispira insulae]